VRPAADPDPLGRRLPAARGQGLTPAGNPKSEEPNPKQIQIIKIKSPKPDGRCFLVWILGIFASNDLLMRLTLLFFSVLPIGPAMRSIRLSLVLYFLVLLVLGLGVVSAIAYWTTAQNVQTREEAMQHHYKAQYERRCNRERS